ncbi:hypothetical protein THRCLA_10700, partial [Thraustotheca clavata]
YFYFVNLGECRLIKRHQPPKSNQAIFIELGTLTSGQFFGSFEILHGMNRSAFSVLVSSPSAVLYRVEKSDLRYFLLKDPITEQLMKADAQELYARMHRESVGRDLKMNEQWQTFKRVVLAEATPRRQAHLTPHLPPFVHSLNPSPLEQQLSPTIKPTPIITCLAPPLLPKRPAIPLKPKSTSIVTEKLFVGQKNWLQTTRKDSSTHISRILLGKPKDMRLDEAINVSGSVCYALKDLSVQSHYKSKPKE